MRSKPRTPSQALCTNDVYTMGTIRLCYSAHTFHNEMDRKVFSLSYSYPSGRPYILVCNVCTLILGIRQHYKFYDTFDSICDHNQRKWAIPQYTKGNQLCSHNDSSPHLPFFQRRFYTRNKKGVLLPFCTMKVCSNVSE